MLMWSWMKESDTTSLGKGNISSDICVNNIWLCGTILCDVYLLDFQDDEIDQWLTFWGNNNKINYNKNINIIILIIICICDVAVASVSGRLLIKGTVFH